MILADEPIEKVNIKSGKTLDAEFCTMLYTLKNQCEFQHTFNFKCKKLKNWKYFAQENDDGVYFESDKIFVAFSPTSDYPFFRFYFYILDDNNNMLLSFINKYNAKPFMGSDIFYKFSFDTSLKHEAQNWFIEKEKEFKSTTTVAQGRYDNTIIDQSFIIRRQPDGCFVCGKKSIGYISTIVSEHNAKFFIAEVCDIHQEEASYSNYALNYIVENLGGEAILPDTVKEEKINQEILDLMYYEIEQELEAKELKEKRRTEEVKEKISKKGEPKKFKTEKQHTAKFVRKTGFVITIRLKTLMDYGYVIDYPNGDQFKRIDSESHHNDILEFAPDHIHNSPHDDIKIQRKEQTIQSSYTTGFPIFDLPAIKQMLLGAEKSYIKEKNC
jgi:hypothetical protein